MRRLLWIVAAGLLAAPAAAQSPVSVVVETVIVPGTDVGFRMALLPGGVFTIGSEPGEVGRDEDEGPRRRVRLQPFWMGVHEVTHDEFAIYRYRRLDDDIAAPDAAPFDADAITRPSPPYEDPAHGLAGEGRPAAGMTRWAALQYARWLSLKTGELYRLPTEAEWEYACRAGGLGNGTQDEDGLAAVAWHAANSQGAHHPVGLLEPNPWGLHDLLGNVAEWTLEPYDEAFYAALPAESVADAPHSGVPGTGRGVVRGGAFDDGPDGLRCADRLQESTSWKRRDPQIPKSRWWNTDAPHVGFRLLREAESRTPEEIRAYWAAVLGS